MPEAAYSRVMIGGGMDSICRWVLLPGLDSVVLAAAYPAATMMSSMDCPSIVSVNSPPGYAMV